MLTESQVEDLSRLDKSYVHGKNILAKHKDKENKKREELGRIYDAYKKFSDGISTDIKASVKALNNYKKFVKDSNHGYSAQSKFEPTIIEEFFCRLLRLKLGNEVLHYGPVKAYSSLYFDYSNKESFKKEIQLKINEKNQDIGIYRKETIITKTNGKEHHISVPIVCVECKTYLDKTMLEGSVSTAAKIKNGNPKCLFFIVTETYDVDFAVDIETSQIDNIYILRKQKRKKKTKDQEQEQAPNDIQCDVIENLIKHVRDSFDLKAISREDRMRTHGYLRRIT